MDAEPLCKPDNFEKLAVKPLDESGHYDVCVVHWSQNVLCLQLIPVNTFSWNDWLVTLGSP